jgi:hypothetical protein
VSGSAADSTVIASSLPVNPRLAGKQICQAVQNEAESNDANGIIKEIDGCHVCVLLFELRLFQQINNPNGICEANNVPHTLDDPNFTNWHELGRMNS